MIASVRRMNVSAIASLSRSQSIPFESSRVGHSSLTECCAGRRQLGLVEGRDVEVVRRLLDVPVREVGHRAVDVGIRVDEVEPLDLVAVRLEVHVDAELDLEERRRRLHARQPLAQVGRHDLGRQHLEEEPLRVARRDDGVGGERAPVDGLDADAPGRPRRGPGSPRRPARSSRRPPGTSRRAPRRSCRSRRAGIHIVRSAWTKNTPAMTAESSGRRRGDPDAQHREVRLQAAGRPGARRAAA